jgi:hypothetical protein
MTENGNGHPEIQGFGGTNRPISRLDDSRQLLDDAVVTHLAHDECIGHPRIEGCMPFSFPR